MRKTSIIIPAFNEALTIGPVLAVALRTTGVHEIIVADDGSQDETAGVAASYGVRVIRLGKNRGKGGAMLAGARAAAGEILVFLDADLVGLTPEHIQELLRPVSAEETEMAVGVFGGGRISTDLAQKIAPNLSGQRAIAKEVFFRIPNLDKTRYGVEIAIANYFRREGLPVSWVPMAGVSQVTKEEKRGFYHGFWARLKMYRDILVSLADR